MADGRGPQNGDAVGSRETGGSREAGDARGTGGEVTRVLDRWNAGDPDAVDRLLPLVYDELRRLARGYFRRQRNDHTLQPTALVHEAYVRLADRVQGTWKDRSHFYAVAATVMRGVLVDHARAQAAAKRGGGAVQVPLEEGAEVADQRATDLLQLDEALSELASFDERKARIIELRYFGGLTIEETAEQVGVSPPTVVNETRRARAWLYRQMHGPEESERGESETAAD